MNNKLIKQLLIAIPIGAVGGLIIGKVSVILFPNLNLLPLWYFFHHPSLMLFLGLCCRQITNWLLLLKDQTNELYNKEIISLDVVSNYDLIPEFHIVYNPCPLQH